MELSVVLQVSLDLKQGPCNETPFCLLWSILGFCPPLMIDDRPGVSTRYRYTFLISQAL